MSEPLTFGMIGDVHTNIIRKDGRGRIKWTTAVKQETLVKEFAVTV